METDRKGGKDGWKDVWVRYEEEWCCWWRGGTDSVTSTIQAPSDEAPQTAERRKDGASKRVKDPFYQGDLCHRSLLLIPSSFLLFLITPLRPPHGQIKHIQSEGNERRGEK